MSYFYLGNLAFATPPPIPPPPPLEAPLKRCHYCTIIIEEAPSFVNSNIGYLALFNTQITISFAQEEAHPPPIPWCSFSKSLDSQK